MKSLIKTILASFIFINAIAAPNSPSTYIPIVIENDGDSQTKFFVPDQTRDSLVPGALYYFTDGENEYQGIYTGVNEEGRAHWTNFEKTPTEDLNSTVYLGPSLSDGKKSSGAPTPSTSNGNYLDSSAHKKGLNSATSTGVAHAIYNGFIFTSGYKSEMARIEADTSKNQAEAEANYNNIRETIVEAQENYKKAIAAFRKSIGDLDQSGSAYSIDFKSNDAALVKDLKSLEKIFRISRPSKEKGLNSRHYGLEMIRQSDISSASGDKESALAFKRYAESFADIMVGFDPLTGPIRDVYEAFTGKNLITGENLETIERTFAVLGAISFGFGSKLSRGIKAVSKVLSSRKFDSIIRAERIAIHAEEKLGAKSRAQYNKYLQDLRRDMERPKFQDPDLSEYMEWFWRRDGGVGNGSTMAAIREERSSGKKVGGRLHTKKGNDAVITLTNWLKNNPNASASDRRAVENIILDLLEALKGEV